MKTGQIIEGSKFIDIYATKLIEHRKALTYNRKLLIFVIILGLFSTSNCWSSPNVALNHDAYNSLDKLAALGLLERVSMTTRPLSRAIFTKVILSTKHTRTWQTLTENERHIAEQELYRLRFWFNDDLTATEKKQKKKAVSYKLRDPLTLSTSYTNTDEKSLRRENSNNRQIYKEGNVELMESAWFSIDSKDKLVIGGYGELFGRVGSSEYTIVPNNVYLFMELFNARVEAGKLSQWWGGGRHGNLILTNNAESMEVIRITNIEPFNFPGSKWDLRVNTFLAHLEEKRIHPGVNLFGLRLTLQMKNIIEIGFSRVTMFGGEGIPRLSVLEQIKLYFADPNQSGKFDVNELGSIDFLLHTRRLLWFGPDIYGELGGEDEAGFRPTKLGYVIGTYFPYIPFLLNTDLRIEYADNHVERFPNIWYSHFIYSTGYTYKGNIIGHHMGNEGRDLYVALSNTFGKLGRVKIAADFQKISLSSDAVESETEYIMNINKFVNKLVSLTIEYRHNIVKNRNNIWKNDFKNRFISISLQVFSPS